MSLPRVITGFSVSFLVIFVFLHPARVLLKFLQAECLQSLFFLSFSYNTSHFPTSIFLCVKMKIIFQIHQTPDVYIYRFFRKESRPNPIVTMGLFIDGWHKSQNDPMRCVKKLPLLLMVRLQNFSISLLRFHKEEFISCSGFSILSMRYPIPMCVWIYCTPFFSGSSFFPQCCHKNPERSNIIFRTASPYLLSNICMCQYFSNITG